MDNFDRPYTARSIAEFWRRWHISLSTWLRDYLYIPLGGNRVAPFRLYLNLMIVFLVCGLWHGASWTFVTWGLIHGLYLVIGLLTRDIRAGIARSLGIYRIRALHKAIQIVTTFILISIAWVFFRADSFSDAVHFFTHLHTGWADIFSINRFGPMIFLGRPKSEFVIAMSSLVFFWIIHFIEDHGNMRSMLSEKALFVRWPVYYALMVAVLLLSATGSEKFIYFQF
jgi:hypothetical protein